MTIGLFISTILPIAVTPILAILGKLKYPKRIKDTKDRFVIHAPEGLVSVGFIMMIIFSVFLFIETRECISNNSPDYLVHILLGPWNYLSAYAILKPLRSRIIVEDCGITVHCILRRTYFFTYDEIISVLRYGNNELNGAGETIIIKTVSGRRVFLDSPCPKLINKLTKKGVEVTHKFQHHTDRFDWAKECEPNIDFFREPTCDVDIDNVQNTVELIKIDQEEIQYSVDTFIYAVKVAKYIIKKYQQQGEFDSYRVITITRYTEENIWHFEYLKGRKNVKIKNERLHVLVNGSERTIIKAWLSKAKLNIG